MLNWFLQFGNFFDFEKHTKFAQVLLQMTIVCRNLHSLFPICVVNFWSAAVWDSIGRDGMSGIYMLGEGRTVRKLIPLDHVVNFLTLPH